MSSLRWTIGAILSTAVLSPLAATAADSTSPPSNSDALAEMVITAQFVKQNLQITPVAITAVTAAMLDSRGQENILEVAGQTPNVTLTTGGAYGGPSLVAFIRGVGQTDFDPALEPGVGLYVDDTYYSTLTGSVLDLLDLDRVEVLRGPQGTLSGKNSIGGSIKMYSKKPSAENDGYVAVEYGSYNAVTVRGATNFTLIPDQLYARISGVSRSRDGYITRLDYACEHPGTALSLALEPQLQSPSCKIGTEGGIKYTAGRLALRWLPAENLELNFAASVDNDVSEAPANVLLGGGPTIAPIIVNGQVWPNLVTVTLPNGQTFQPLPATFQPCVFITSGAGSCDTAKLNNPYANYATYTDPRTGLSITPNQTVKSHDLSLNVDWKLTDALDLQSITAYRNYVSGFGDDQSAAPFPVADLYQTLTHHQTSQEFRLNGKVDKLVDYTLGAFYFDQYTAHDGRIELGYVGFDFVHGPDPVNAKNWALFGHTIVHATDKLDLSLGLRYSDDKKDYQYARHNPDGSLIQPCIGPPGTPGNPPNCVISSLNGTTSSFHGARTDYRAAVTYKWTDSFMTYAQYSTGYKGGGVNPRPFYNVQAVPFQPETLEAFEVGAKSQMLDNRLRLNVALFKNKYKDIQLTLQDCSAIFGPQFGVPCLLPANSGDADVTGGEVELAFNPVRGLQLDASYSHLDFSMTRVNAITGVTLSDVTPYTPKNKWSAGIQYQFDFGSAGSITPRVDAAYQSSVFTDPINSVLGEIDSYTLVNARITWLSAQKDWQVALEGQNLGDKMFYTSKLDTTNSGGGIAYGTPGLPRTVMLSVKRSF